MAGRSSILVIALAFGVLGSMLYISTVQSSNKIVHDPKVIPTEPKIAQINAIRQIETSVHSHVKQLDVLKLDYQMYNFSYSEYISDNEKYMEYRHKLIYGWDVEHIKKYPSLLNLPSYFIHANGTAYAVNGTNHSYHKVCEQPSSMCPMGRIVTDAVKDRLVYYAEAAWSPPMQEPPYNYGQFAVDAETGEVAFDSIQYAKNVKPTPNVNFDNKTISQIYNELANPPETTKIDIEQGASDQSANKSYLPKESRVTLGINNKIVWTNRDAVAESVVSDSGYIDELTGKKFESRLIPPGGTFEFTFTKEGEYSYHAEPHPWMRGKITVVESFA